MDKTHAQRHYRCAEHTSHILTLFLTRGFACDGARRVGPVHARKRPRNGPRAAKAGGGRLTGMDALLPSRSDAPLDLRPEWWCSRRAGLRRSARRHADHQKCSVSLSARARTLLYRLYNLTTGPWVKDSDRVRACGSWLNLPKKLARPTARDFSVLYCRPRERSGGLVPIYRAHRKYP